MKKYILPVIMTVFTLVTLSCTKDFLNRNTNQEEATVEDLKHDGLGLGGPFAAMTLDVNASYHFRGTSEYGSDRYQVIQDLAGNIFSGYTAATNSGFQANNLYDITHSGWYETMYNDVYTYLVMQWYDLEKSGMRENAPQEMALVDIVKVLALHRVTDTYGPIPYSSIIKTTQQRSYDAQSEVYTQMFKELDNAIDVLTVPAQSGATLLSKYDNVFYGDVAKWVKMANTLRLRLAMRVVYADETLAYAEAEKSLSNPVGLMASASDAAYLHAANGAAWQYPLYTIQYDFNNGDSSIGATIETYMNAYDDPRRDKLFTKAPDGSSRDYIGVRGGVTNGSDYKLKVSRVNCTKDDPLLWMAPAEAYFLQAEYWLRKEDTAKAKELYEAGVKVAFETTGAGDAETYLASEATVGSYTDPVGGNSYGSALTETPVSWDAVSSFENHLEQIITQKYFAMFPDGQEAWSEFRRTGYPKVIPVARNNSNGAIDTQLQIRRLNFPSSEYRTNSDSVNEAVTLLTQEAKSGTADNGGTRLWWDKNPNF